MRGLRKGLSDGMKGISKKLSRKKKGEKGYLDSQKKVAAIRTAILFSISLAIYLTGYFSSGTNENLLTIVAVLGCLPAARSAVNLIMLLRYHGIKDGDFRKISEHTEGCAVLADLVFTSYEKNFEIHHMAYRAGYLLGYTANSSCDGKACEKHLHNMCAQNALGDVKISIFSELPNYLRRLDQIRALPEDALSAVGETEDGTKTERICALMRAISL